MSDLSLRYAVALCQTDFPCPVDRSEISGRVDRMLEMVDGAVIGYRPFFDVRLVVFPEFAHAAQYMVPLPIAAEARRSAPNEHLADTRQSPPAPVTSNRTFIEVTRPGRGALTPRL